jgi:hypothetical protein
VQRRYGRAQFLRDAIALGLPVRQAFSRTALRRQRDLLMRAHHPDRGGSDERAKEINDIYARMTKWLDDRGRPQGPPAGQDDQETTFADGAGRDEATSAKILKKAASVALWAVALAASSYVAARKSRRR